MKAAVLNEQPGALSIEDITVDAPGANEVLVRVVGAGLCHSDLHFMEGTFRTPLPSVLGHESAGVVEAVGSDVTYCKPGDHVICCLSVFCGQCRQCLSGHPYRCMNPDATSRPKAAPARLRRSDGSAVDQFARLSIEERGRSTAQPRSGFEHQHTRADAGQSRGRAQASESSANDDDVVAGHAWNSH